jgi:hypothetical protein
MSHFTTLRTQITDVDCLKKALVDLGFPTVEVHATPQHLYGYQGDVRPDTAEVIVRRRHVGFASNDLGFKRRADGAFDAVVSAYDRSGVSGFSHAWLDRLSQRYAYHVALKKLAEQGFALAQEETSADGRVRLVLRRMA